MSFTKGDEKSTEEDEKAIKASPKYYRITAASRNHYSNQQTTGYSDLQQFRCYMRGSYPHQVTQVQVIQGTLETTQNYYLYDGGDQRIGKKVVTLAQTTQEMYIKDALGRDLSIVTFITSNGNTTQSKEYFVHGTDRVARVTAGSTTPLEKIQPDEATFFLYDHLGNTRVAFQVDGSNVPLIVNALDYYSYGKILREYDNGAGDRYLTTGHERDKETGLDYRGARYYDSDIGRFLSLDPLAIKYPSLNPYNYVAGNPIMFIDPDGKDIKPTESFAGSPLNKTLNNLRANNSTFNKYFEKFSTNKSFNITFDVNNTSVPSGSLAFTSYNYSWKTNSKGEKYTSAVESTISFRDDIYYNEIGQAVLISHEAIHAYAGLMRVGGDDTNHDKWDNYLSIMTKIVTEIASDNGLELNATEIKELSLYNVGPGGKVYDEYVSALAKSNGTTVDDEIKALDSRMEKIITTPTGE